MGNQIHSPEEALAGIFGDTGYGVLAANALRQIAMIPLEEFDHALRRIDHMIAIGPLFNPTGCLAPNWFKNADKNREVMEALRGLRAIIGEPE
jgi:hypothetical protein